MIDNPFIQQLNDAQDVVKTFKDGQKVLDVVDIISNYESHYALAQAAIKPFFERQDDVEYQTEQAILVIKQQEKNAYSITALVCAAIKSFGLTMTDKVSISPVITAALLSDIGANERVEYHNHQHFMRVVTHIIRLMSTHNFLETNKLSQDDIAKLMIAACIHDLGHEGVSNVIEGAYHMAKTELKSFNLAQPFLVQSGLSNGDLDDIKVMLLTTDVTIFPEVVSPSSYLQAAYAAHFDGEKLAKEFVPMLLALKSRKDLCLLSMLLHEADIMNSAGLSYDITRGESIKVSKESGRSDSLPEHTLMFLEKICHGTFFTKAAIVLGNENLKEIISQVELDYKNGNTSYF